MPNFIVRRAVRLSNLFILVAIAIVCFLAFVVLSTAYIAFGMFAANNWWPSLGEAMIRALAIRYVIAYALLSIGGMIVVRALDSDVPINWCLALGCLWAIPYLTFAATVSSDNWVLTIVLAFGLVAAPVLGGIQFKSYLQRKLKRPPN